MTKHTPLNTLGKQTNRLDVILDTLKKNIFSTLNVCIPATVTKYNKSNNTVDLQPAIQVVLTDNSFLDMPQVFDIPILEMGGNGLSIRIPLKSGDTGFILFCDRDITLFKQEKKKTQPNTLRKHDLSDGIFIPMKFGGVGVDDRISISSDDGSIKFEVTSSGINVKGNITVDGEITATDVKTATNVSLKNHKHGGVRAGSDSTAVPTPSA